MTNVCSSCHSANAIDSRFCQQCGQALAAASVPVDLSAALADATIRWTGQPLALKSPARRATPLDTLFKGKNRIVIGRAPECEIYLAHPMVSRRHALLERVPEGLRLSDLGSVNGVSLGGRRLTEPVFVREREQIGIGPFLLSLVGGVIHTIDGSRSLRLEARQLEKSVRLGDGTVRKLLDNINLAVEPGEFVSLLGPSGSGKSTLMDCLNGRRRATGGHVLANGEDFYRHFDNFRQSLGYVPQRDIVHTQLTVHRALYYTARLRLPTDTGPTELAARIEEVIQVMELGPHRDTLVANLSGGQIKRVSLGAELLARPCLLYIDEATSGLDAGTEARMMRLFRQLADEGKSILCITHNVDNVDRCHLAIVLARGKLIYFGPPQEAPPYFGVKRVSDIYDRIAEQELPFWEKQFATSSFYREFVEKRLANLGAEAAPAAPPSGASRVRTEAPGKESLNSSSIVLAPESRPLPRAQRPPLWHQFRVLTTRYAELMWGDPRSLRLLMLQAPLVALFVLAGFVNKPYEDRIPLPRHLTSQEEEILQVLDSLEHDLAPEGTAERTGQEKALTQIHFKLRQPGATSTLDGLELRRRLQQLRSLPPDSLERKALEQVQVDLVSNGNHVALDTTQLLVLQDFLHKSRLADKLLTANKKVPVVPDRDIIDPSYTFRLLFMMTVIVLWFGCNNAAKEIVKEEAIYGRERAVNLGILPYLSSKFLVLSFVTAVQALLLMVIVHGTMELLRLPPFHLQAPPLQYQLAYLPQFGVLVLLSMTSVALGLLLSACVSNPDRANALLPYVLIPQIILGGGILPVRGGPLQVLAMLLSPVYWAFRAVHLGANQLPDYSPYHMEYTDNLWLSCGAIGLELAVCLVLTAWFLRRKDVNKG